MTLVAVLGGIAVVLLAILWWKLPAFLALLMGAVVTGLLTDPAEREETVWSGSAVEVDRSESFGIGRQRFHFAKPVRSRGLHVLIPRNAGSGRLPTLTSYIELEDTPGGHAVRTGSYRGVYFGSLPRPASRPSKDLLIPVADVPTVQETLDRNIGERLAYGFGRTAGKIGLIVALAAVIGQCLLHSGAADRIVRTLLRFTGERAAPAAFVVSGFVLGIPVFFDTVFYLMIPLGKAMWRRTRKSYVTYVLTIVCGGTMAHSLVPPTPGPLLVATELGVPIAQMIGYGCGVGLVTVIVGYVFATVVGGRSDVTPPEEEDETVRSHGPTRSPNFFVSLAPIVLPVVLISVASLIKGGAFALPDALASYGGLIQTLGNKNVALLIAAAYAVVLLALFNRSGRPLADVLQDALMSGAMIVLITGAGGAFGVMLQEAGLRSLISQMPAASTPVLLCLAFGVTTFIRTAQGSATVAMITAVALFTDLTSPEVLGCSPVYLALAIGCGSKPFAWMNDSGFWVITRLSGLTPQQGLKFVTPMTALMGLVGLGTTIMLATVWP